jgi:hypothetical protein
MSRYFECSVHPIARAGYSVTRTPARRSEDSTRDPAGMSALPRTTDTEHPSRRSCASASATATRALVKKAIARRTRDVRSQRTFSSTETRVSSPSSRGKKYARSPSPSPSSNR